MPKTPKAARTRRRLIDVAGQLFIERGYGAVSMRDIAAAADLTHGAIYGHFRSKGQLLIEVIRWQIAEQDYAPGHIEAVSSSEGAVEQGYTEGRLKSQVLEVDACAAARHDPDVAAGLAAYYQERLALLQEYIRSDPDHADPDTAAWLIHVYAAGLSMKYAAGIPFPDPDRLYAATRAMFRGLAEG
jgi:AcrR family transcriptional regulator